MAEGAALPDGRYDAIVVDAGRTGEDLRVELTILAGNRKGEVVAVVTSGVGRDELDLLGVPATITVADGQPAVAFEG